jgi:hypothetical protein
MKRKKICKGRLAGKFNSDVDDIPFGIVGGAESLLSGLRFWPRPAFLGEVKHYQAKG